MTDSAKARAEESVSSRFTRLMNATTSPWGVLTDPSIVGVATAPFVIGLLAALRLDGPRPAILALEALVATPLSVAILCALVLSGARRKVIDWLASLPFPVENMNAVLNGLGESLEVSFSGSAPEAPSLNVALDKICAESFVTAVGPEGREPEEGELRWVELRIGVVDSIRNPSRSNHQRFQRVQAIVQEALLPLHAEHPIAVVRVK
jgi:hypothetical protein